MDSSRMNVVGLFKSRNDAYVTVQDLTERGIDRNDISIVTQEDDHHEGSGNAKGAAAGAGTGAAAGGILGLLAGLGAMLMPGIGLVAGPIVGLLTSAAAGAAGGGLLGALVGLGISDAQAETYERGIREGGTLLVVHTPEHLRHDAALSLRKHGAENVHLEGAEA